MWELQVLLQYIVDYAEKIRNLFLWENPTRTGYFCIAILVGAYVLIAIPSRILIGYIITFYLIKGKKFT